MKRLLTILAATATALTLNAAYIVHGINGNVGIAAGGNVTPLKKGMTVSPSDMMDIPAGASVDIYNELDGKIYTSVKSGRLTVIRLMLDAKEKAADNAANVQDHMSMSKKSGKPEGRLYMEKGMVKRSKGIYNHALENVDVDPRTLARFVASAVYSGELKSRFNLPVSIDRLQEKEDGCGFRLINTMDYPIYFNVLKVIGKESPILDVSELGQPSGCYMVLPGQSISREQFAGMSPHAKHILIMSHCKYDISEVIDTVEDLIQNEGLGTLTDKDAPVDMVIL